MTLEEIRTDLERARQRVRDLEELERLAVKLYGPPDSMFHQAGMAISVDDEGAPAQEGPLSGRPTKDAILFVLQESGRAMKLADILDRLDQLGWRTTSSDSRG